MCSSSRDSLHIFTISCAAVVEIVYIDLHIMCSSSRDSLHRFAISCAVVVERVYLFTYHVHLQYHVQQ